MRWHKNGTDLNSIYLAVEKRGVCFLGLESTLRYRGESLKNKPIPLFSFFFEVGYF